MTFNAASLTGGTITSLATSTTGVTAQTVTAGGTLTVDNTGTNNPNRINDAAALALAGGTFNYLGTNNLASTETLGNLTINAGNGTINPMAAGSGTTALTFGTYTRNIGGMVNFVAGAAGNQTLGTNDAITFTADPRTNGILRGAIVTDQASGLVNLATSGTAAPFSLSALTAYTNTNLATGGAATDNDLYTASTATTGAISANAILIRGDDITISGANTMTLSGAGMFVFADNGNTGNTISAAIPNFGAIEGIFITANTGGSTGAATISSAIPATSTAGITIGGTGTLALSGANLYVNTTFATTYPYATTVNSGTLVLGNATALGAGAVDILGGTLQSNAALTVANALTLNTGGGGALTVSGANNLTLSGVISGTGSLVENMNSTSVVLTLAGATANTYSGSTVVNAGTLSLAKTAAVAAVVGQLVIGDGSGGNNADLVSVSTSNSQITGPVTVNATGQLNMSTLTATIGVLILDGGNVAGTGALTLGANLQTLAAAAAATITNPVVLTANRTINVAAGGGANDLSMNGLISGAFDVTKIGGGTLTYGGTVQNTYSGTTTVAEGTLMLAKSAAVNALTGTLVVGNFSGTDTVKVTTNFNQFANTNEPVIVNGSGTLRHQRLDGDANHHHPGRARRHGEDGQRHPANEQHHHRRGDQHERLDHRHGHDQRQPAAGREHDDQHGRQRHRSGSGHPRPHLRCVHLDQGRRRHAAAQRHRAQHLHRHGHDTSQLTRRQRRHPAAQQLRRRGGPRQPGQSATSSAARAPTRETWSGCSPATRSPSPRRHDQQFGPARPEWLLEHHRRRPRSTP